MGHPLIVGARHAGELKPQDRTLRANHTRIARMAGSYRSGTVINSDSVNWWAILGSNQ